MSLEENVRAIEDAITVRDLPTTPAEYRQEARLKLSILAPAHARKKESPRQFAAMFPEWKDAPKHRYVTTPGEIRSVVTCDLGADWED